MFLILNWNFRFNVKRSWEQREWSPCTLNTIDMYFFLLFTISPKFQCLRDFAKFAHSLSLKMKMCSPLSCLSLRRSICASVRPEHSLRAELSRGVQSGAATHSWCFVKSFWNVLMTVELAYQLLSSSIGNLENKHKIIARMNDCPTVYFCQC